MPDDKKPPLCYGPSYPRPSPDQLAFYRRVATEGVRRFAEGVVYQLLVEVDAVTRERNNIDRRHKALIADHAVRNKAREAYVQRLQAERDNLDAQLTRIADEEEERRKDNIYG